SYFSPSPRPWATELVLSIGITSACNRAACYHRNATELHLNLRARTNPGPTVQVFLLLTRAREASTSQNRQISNNRALETTSRSFSWGDMVSGALNREKNR